MDLFYAKTVNDLPKSVRDTMKHCLMLTPSLPQRTVLLRLPRNGTAMKKLAMTELRPCVAVQ